MHKHLDLFQALVAFVVFGNAASLSLQAPVQTQQRGLGDLDTSGRLGGGFGGDGSGGLFGGSPGSGLNAGFGAGPGNNLGRSGGGTEQFEGGASLHGRLNRGALPGLEGEFGSSRIVPAVGGALGPSGSPAGTVLGPGISSPGQRGSGPGGAGPFTGGSGPGRFGGVGGRPGIRGAGVPSSGLQPAIGSGSNALSGAGGALSGSFRQRGPGTGAAGFPSLTESPESFPGQASGIGGGLGSVIPNGRPFGSGGQETPSFPGQRGSGSGTVKIKRVHVNRG